MRALDTMNEFRLKKPLLYFAGGEWDVFPPRGFDLIKAFGANAVRTLWVDPVATRPPKLAKADSVRIWRRLKKTFLGVWQADTNISVCSPLSIPLESNPSVRRLNYRLQSFQIKKALHELHFDNPIIWTTTPLAIGVIKTLNYSLLVYDIQDEYTKFPGMDHMLLQECETPMLKHADLIMVVSEQLRVSKGLKGYTNVKLLPNGVNFELFVRTQDPKTEIPAEMRTIRKPIAGYVGNIYQRLDMEMITQVAERRPDWSFVFIGLVRCNLERLAKLQNVYFLGMKPPFQLPGYMKAFDVALIPHLVDTFTVCQNPVKLYEYLAAGLPIVSTPLPELEPYREVVRFGRNAEEFSAGLEEAFHDISTDRLRKRQEIARQNTWQARAHEALEYIREHVPSSS